MTLVEYSDLCIDESVSLRDHKLLTYSQIYLLDLHTVKLV